MLELSDVWGCGAQREISSSLHSGLGWGQKEGQANMNLFDAETGSSQLVVLHSARGARKH
jgi:hypothetical protein